MRKRLCNKSLRLRCRCSAHRRAFSLAELIVSIGVLVLMFSLAGQVFNMTVSSTGQARALTGVSQLLRAFERTLREDLRHVQPGRSLILIQGNPVNAYWTAEGREAAGGGSPAAGYPHINDPAREDANRNLIMPRADILMFFTARKGSSFVYPNVGSSLQQVVYGHAELGEYVPGAVAGGALYDFAAGPEAFPVDAGLQDYPSYQVVSQISADRWHLSRRGRLLLPTAPPAGANPPWANAAAGTLAYGLGDVGVLQGETDVVGNFTYEGPVDGPVQGLVLTPGVLGPWYLPRVFDDAMVAGAGTIGGLAIPHARSQLDPTTPASYASRLGHYLLPSCASFKVEWALDPHSEFVAGRLDGMAEVLWFDPGRFDPVNVQEHPLAELERAAADASDPELQVRLLDLLDGRTLHPDDIGPYSLADRFLGQQFQERRGFDPINAWPVLAPDARPNLIVFGAARRRAGRPVEVVPEDIFPGALRITIDVYDDGGRLERPMRHVMVVPVGG